MVVQQAGPATGGVAGSASGPGLDVVLQEVTKANRPRAINTRAVQKKSRQRPTFAVRLSSALAGLTSVFGMGTGVTLPV